MKRAPLATRLLLTACLAAAAGQATAYIVPIDQGPEAVYLRVGDGGLGGQLYSDSDYDDNNVPAGSQGGVSLVSVTVPQALVGNGNSQLMSGTGSGVSDYDGFQFCNAGQVYIGGFYRRNNNGNRSGRLTYTAPAFLTNAAGDTIPISQISWTTSGNGDFGGQPVPGNLSFQPGTQDLAMFRRNEWRESCMTFRYANDNVVRGGSYTGRVVYTLTAP